MSRYVIRHHSEETDCDWCGWPMYGGDAAHYAREHVFCSSECVDRYREALALRQDEDAAATFRAAID